MAHSQNPFVMPAPCNIALAASATVQFVGMGSGGNSDEEGRVAAGGH